MGTPQDSRTKAREHRALICEDCGNWVADTLGNSAFLTVELSVQVNSAHKRRLFVFTLLRQTPPRPERVYQLVVNQGAKLPKDLHSRSHEHYGEIRADIPQELGMATFEELLRYFCSRTGLIFRPPPSDPIKLTGRKR
jgi:hypothetical protein